MVTDTISRAAVQTGVKTTEIRDIPLPKIPPDAGLLRAIAAGICVIEKQITVRGVRGHSYKSVELALDLMARKTIDRSVMSSHDFGLDKVDHALRLVGGEIQDGAIHVTITPWN